MTPFIAYTVLLATFTPCGPSNALVCTPVTGRTFLSSFGRSPNLTRLATWRVASKKEPDGGERRTSSGRGGRNKNQSRRSNYAPRNGEGTTVQRKTSYFYSTSRVPSTEDLPRTLAGGESLLFAMARTLFTWDNTGYKMATGSEPVKVGKSNGHDQVLTDNYSSAATELRSQVTGLPRWRPMGGVQDCNENFRQSAPKMNSDGYAGSIRRNARKKNKPSMWKHALRMYHKIAELEQNGLDCGDSVRNNETISKSSSSKSVVEIVRKTVHYEAALVACAKLANWEEALQIFSDAEKNSKKLSTLVSVTDTMVVSVIRACVRSSRRKGARLTREARRQPLDAAIDLVLTMEANHKIPLEARHVNPLAAALQTLGFFDEASQLIRDNLSDRVVEGEELNVFNLDAKDEGSYSLLVKGAVAIGNWSGAVDALKEMTGSGVYPKSRSLNSWQEAAERKKSKLSSWKKKRDESWVRYTPRFGE